MKHAFSVLIPDGESLAPPQVVRCLARTGRVKQHALSSKRWTMGRFSRYLSAYECNPSASDPEERIQTILAMIRRYNIDVVLPISLRGVEFVSRYYQPLSEAAAVAPVPRLDAFAIAGNKWSLNQFAARAGVPVPLAIQVTLDSPFYQQLSNLEYPVLLKPAQGRGGVGISRFDTLADLQAFLKTQQEADLKNQYLVQEYVPGVTLGINVLCREGEILAFTIQESLLAHGFGPSKAIRFIQQEDVLENARTLLAALNWSGVANMDMRYDTRNGQVKLLEVNPRFWLNTAASLVVGVNFPYLTCLAALQIPFPVPPYRPGQFIQNGTAAKDLLRRLSGKGEFNGFKLRETGWAISLTDPLPELVNAVAEFGRHGHSRRFVPAKLLNFFNEVAT